MIHPRFKIENKKGKEEKGNEKREENEKKWEREKNREKIYLEMKEITHDDYLDFVKKNDKVVIEDTEIKLQKVWKIKSYGPPDDYIPERTTIWSFPERGDWATHRGDYRGNWSPYIPRNLILKYTQKGDWVLDQSKYTNYPRLKNVVPNYNSLEYKYESLVGSLKLEIKY